MRVRRGRSAASGRRSENSLQREREYHEHDWLLHLPSQHREDENCDDSWAHFMKERRAQKEHERYERRRGERQPRRSAAQQNGMTAWERRCANESAVASGIAIAKPRGQAPHGFPVWDSHFGVWTREVGGLSNGLRDESEWRAPKQKFPKPAGSAQCKRGRPIDPSSRHQQKVQRRAAAQRRVLEQQVAQLGLEDELAVKQHEFIEHCEANARELTQAIRVLGSQGSVALYDHLTDHGADITTSDMQRVIARVESGGDVHWTDLHGSGAAWGYCGISGSVRGDCCATFWADPARTPEFALPLRQPAITPCATREEAYSCRCFGGNPQFRVTKRWTSQYFRDSINLPKALQWNSQRQTVGISPIPLYR